MVVAAPVGPEREECCEEETAVPDEGALVDLLLWLDIRSVEAMTAKCAPPGGNAGACEGSGGCGDSDGRRPELGSNGEASARGGKEESEVRRGVLTCARGLPPLVEMELVLPLTLSVVPWPCR